MPVQKYWELFHKSIVKFIQDKPLLYSASIAFYTIFSLPAILIITMNIAGTAYETETIQNSMIDQISYLLGPESAELVNQILAKNQLATNTFLARVSGIITLMISGTTVFISLQTALNDIWKVKVAPKKGLQNLIFKRLISMAMILSFGFLLMVSLVLDAFVAISGKILAQWLSQDTYYIMVIINAFISLAIASLIFALIFKVLPDAQIQWKDVWVGAILTTLLFTLGKFLIGYYIGNSSVGNAYGAASSLVVFLVWVFYSTSILLFGAEFTNIYASERQQSIKPEGYAVMVKEVTDLPKKN